MRRFAMYLLALLAVLALTGCAARQDAPETTMASTAAMTVAAEETEAPAQTETAQPSNGQLAMETAMNFAGAYFQNNPEVMKQYLTEPYDFSLDTYSDGYAVTDIQFQGFNGVQPMDAFSESCVASVQFRETAESDSFTYLTIEMQKQDGQWRVSFYGLEK